MKNYYFENEDKSKSFILNYEFKNNQIIVHFGSGKDSSFPYTKENEEKILEKMKNQIEDNILYKENSLRNIKIIETSVIKFFSIMLTFSIIAAPFNLFYFLFIFILSFGSSSILLLVAKKKRNLIKDFEKQILFLNNQEKLKAINEKNSDILKNISEKNRDLTSSISTEQPMLTLNTIHKMKYKELKKIIENIKIEEAEYVSSSIEEQKRYSKK